MPIGWDPDNDVFEIPQPTLFDAFVPPTKDPPPELGLPVARVQQLARCVIEVLNGQRPVTQLGRWMTESAQASLALTARRSAQRPPLRIASLHCDPAIPGVVEAALRVTIGPRSAAMAFRLEQRGRAWVCTAWDHRPADLLPPAPRRRLRTG